jgi:hypothetical protein
MNLRTRGEFPVLFARIIGEIVGYLQRRTVHRPFADGGACRRVRVCPGNDCGSS